MQRLVMLAVAVIVMLAATELDRNHAARACSGDPNFNPVAASDVIVEGRFLLYEVLPDNYTPYAVNTTRLQLGVANVLKGSIDDDVVTLLDDGICGGFDVDPTGQYAVIGLEKLSGYTHNPRTFYIGDNASSEEYEKTIRRVEDAADKFDWTPVALGTLIGLGLPLLAVAAYYSPRNK